MTVITKIGVSLSLFSITAWLIDRLGGQILSTRIGQWFCGEHYMQEINGVLSDQSCGFNTDMHLAALLFLALLVGILLSLATTVFFRGNAYM